MYDVATKPTKFEKNSGSPAIQSLPIFLNYVYKGDVINFRL